MFLIKIIQENLDDEAMLKDMLETLEKEVQIKETIFKTEETLKSLEEIHENISLNPSILQNSSIKTKLPILNSPFFDSEPLLWSSF